MSDTINFSHINVNKKLQKTRYKNICFGAAKQQTICVSFFNYKPEVETENSKLPCQSLVNVPHRNHYGQDFVQTCTSLDVPPHTLHPQPLGLRGGQRDL